MLVGLVLAAGKGVFACAHMAMRVNRQCDRADALVHALALHHVAAHRSKCEVALCSQSADAALELHNIFVGRRWFVHGCSDKTRSSSTRCAKHMHPSGHLKESLSCLSAADLSIAAS